MNQARKRPMHQKVLSMILVLVMLLGLLSVSAFTVTDTTSSDSADTSYKYNIMFLDCGRKYYSVDSIKKIINNASAAGFNYIQLAVGNDGLRFLLNDMSLTVKGTTYDSEAVKSAIHAGNEAYYNFPVDELNQSEMDTIIAYAGSKGMGVIPCVNTPGHMDAILSAATSLTGKTCSYSGSARTIDVTNGTAVAFTQALLQKYINYFAGQGCKLFNMGADEYANDIYTSGSMGFGNLQSTGKYSSYVKYVNAVDNMIQAAGMTAMAFNDGIYFNSNTSSGTFNTDIVVCYWSNGWSGYSPMPASELEHRGFKLINTHGDYYWVLGKPDWQCSKTKASGFNYKQFQGSTISTPAGSMFCIWADYPGAETEANVISKTADTIAAFGKTLPTVKKVETVESKTVTKGDVAVTAPGLTDLTVTEATAPTIDTAADGKVSAYDVTPATKNGSYAGRGSVSLPVPKGWDASRVRGYIVNEDGSVTTGLTGTTANGKFTFTVPHFSQMGIYELAANAATDTKEITLTVGGTKTDALDGDYSGTRLNDDIATVTGSVAETPGKTTYQLAALGADTFYVSTKSDDTAPTVQLTFEDAGNGQYYIKNSDGKYLYPTADYSGFFIWGSWKNYRVTTTNTKNEDAAVKVVTNNDGSIVISKTVTSGEQSTTAYLTLNGTSLGASENSTSLYLYQQQTTPGGKETTLTFTGKSVGTTKVTIGDTQYIIKVTAEDLSTVTPLTVEYWITNRQVTAGGKTSKEIQATDSSVYSETGAKFSGLVPATGTQGDNTDVFWKGTRLTSANKQTNESGVDQTRNGDDFAYIRYWNQKWSFSADGTSWTDFNADDQVVAYYLQKTPVTDEVTTEVVDWGELWSGYSDSNYVIVDYAVKYQSGTRSPDRFPVTGKTLGFHCNYRTDLNKSVFKDQDTGTYYRSIGMIKGEETANYEVYMITLTPTSDNASTTLRSTCSSNSSISYDGTEKVVWVDNEDNLGAFKDESLHYTSISGDIKYSVGGEPIVPGLEIYNQHGVLVTYYVREKVTADSLHVHYIDTTGNTSNEFYSYPINVHKSTTFDKNIGLDDPWKGDLKNGSVTNIADKQQTVSADLSTMPAIGASYKYSKYKCDRVKRSDDGKDVYLYYTFNNKVSYVVDFGLPLNIQLSDLNASLKNANVESATVEGAKYGTATYADKVVTYTPTKAINAIDTLSVIVAGRITYTDDNGEQVTRNDKVSYMVDIIPATSVYYEDSFAKFTNADGTTDVNKKTDKGFWTTDNDGTGQSENVKQALEALGNKKNVYGYDDAYANCNTFSMGSATKVTVDANTADNGQWPTAAFTFKGTGFDVISLTNSDAGTVVYTVTNKSTGKSESHIINNYYGYAYVNGQWVETNKDTTAPYQVPVIKVSGLAYDTYEVKISVVYGAAFDKTNDNQYSFWLDAIRVYDPAGDALNDEYARDGENVPNYVEVKKVILDTGALGNEGAVGAVFIDGKGKDGVTADDYKNQGPNHEAYLAKNQAIAFQLIANGKPSSVQIGAKLANGTSAKLSITGATCGKAINGSLTLNTATDMYYELTNLNWTPAADGTYKSNVITLTNTSDNNDIVSLTNVKFIGATYSSALPSAKATEDEATVVTFAASAAMVDEAVSAVDGVLNPAPQVFAPSRFEASWGHAVRKGNTATLTVKASEDVDSITVDGHTITTYATKTERTGWGWWAKTVTYREFTYQVAAEETTDYTICAVNSAGVSSDPITATLTVRPSVRDWWHGIFDKWF